MARTGVTYSEIAEAAAQIEGRGQAATVDSVRQFLCTGSRTTIANHLRAWKSQQTSADISGIPQELVAMVKGLWDRLQSIADVHVKDIEAETKIKIDEAQQQFEYEKKNSASLQTKIKRIDERNHEQYIQIERLKAEAALLKQQKAKLEAQAAGLKDQLGEQKNENNKLHKINHRIQNHLEQNQAEVLKLRQENTLALEKQRQAFVNEIQQLKSIAQEKIQTNHHLEIQFKHSNQHIDELKVEVKELKKVNTNDKLKLNESAIVINNLQSRYDLLDKDIRMIKQELKEQNVLNNELERKNAVLNDQITKYEKSLENTSQVIALLRTEKLEIAQEKANLLGQIKQMRFALEKTN